mmetsp:Transcript_47167/g.131678  ORF Transcript_47167/g.131678 Transcript_47167/m.131678 type:complete len:226 (+) Transcript_47167:372-1049(+)
MTSQLGTSGLSTQNADEPPFFTELRVTRTRPLMWGLTQGCVFPFVAMWKSTPFLSNAEEKAQCTARLRGSKYRRASCPCALTKSSYASRPFSFNRIRATKLNVMFALGTPPIRTASEHNLSMVRCANRHVDQTAATCSAESSADRVYATIVSKILSSLTVQRSSPLRSSHIMSESDMEPINSSVSMSSKCCRMLDKHWLRKDALPSFFPHTPRRKQALSGCTAVT